MKYEKPFMEIVVFEKLNVITMSLGEDGGNAEINPENYDPDAY